MLAKFLENLKLQRILLNIFLLGVNFDKFTIGLHLFIITSILPKFLEN